MAILNFDDLKAAIVDFTPELSTSDPIDLFVSLAEAEFTPYVKHFKAEVSVVLATTDNAMTLPDDFQEAIRVYVDGKPATPVSRHGATLSAGEVGYFQAGDAYVFVPAIDASRQVELDYYARPCALSVTQPSNWLLSRFPNLYLHAALAQGFNWRGNKEAEAAAKAQVAMVLGVIADDHKRATQISNQFVIFPGGFN